MKRAPRNIGHVDAVEGGFVRGWALQKHIFGKLSEVEVRVLLDGAVVAATRANTHRPDLKQQGYGTGNYGFLLRLPEGLMAGGPYDLAVMASPGEQILTGGGVTILNGDSLIRHAASALAQDDPFFAIHGTLQYEVVQNTARDAAEINREIGAVPAICLIYARLLGRMPKDEVIASAAKRPLEASDLVELANKIYFGEEGLRRRGQRSRQADRSDAP